MGCRCVVHCALALVCACGGDTPILADDASVAVAPAPAVAPQDVSPPPFPDTTRSVRLTRSVAVHVGPSQDSKRLGTVAKNVRTGWKQRADGPDCQNPWVELEPRGWVCGDYVEASPDGTWGVELPRVRRGQVVPGVYGQVTAEGAVTFASPEDVDTGTVKRSLAGAVKVRREGQVVHNGRQLWRIARGEYVPAESVRVFAPSRWRGPRVGDHTGLVLPIGFALAARGRTRSVSIYSEADGGRVVGSLGPRAVVPVVESTATAHRIATGQWVRAADLRVAARTDPPDALLPGERWVDVDVDAQVLVAYEGSEPVFATLVSSGSKKYPSETGIFRVWIKFAETDMNGQMGDDAPYSVATVPWTQFYAKDLALHTAYWHDKFGKPLSHGCVNLAPQDARFLYFWSEPSVPLGWSMAHGIVERPGSIVRVRSAADPDPEPKGYAKRVYEARVSRRLQ